MYKCINYIPISTVPAYFFNLQIEQKTKQTNKQKTKCTKLSINISIKQSSVAI